MVVGGGSLQRNSHLTVFLLAKAMPVALGGEVSLENENMGALVSVVCFTWLFALRSATSLLKTRFSYGA